MDMSKMTDIAKNVSLVGLLLGILYLSFNGDWVWSKSLKEEQARTAAAVAERDRWQQLALQGTKFAEQAVMKNSSLKGELPPVNHNYTAEDIQNRLNKVNEIILKSRVNVYGAPWIP